MTELGPLSMSTIEPTQYKVIILIIVLVLVASLALFGFFFVDRKGRDAIQCHFAVELLAIIVTAFTSFLAVATGAVGQSPNSAQGDFGVITISLIGPAAVWAGSRAILKWAYPISFLQEQRQSADEAAVESEARLGWTDYISWRRSLGRFGEAITSMEMHFIDDLLPKVFYHGQNATRPIDVQIRSAFFYRKNKVVKLQRIQGVYSGGGDRPRLYLPSTASSPDGRARCIHAFQQQGRISQIGTHKNGDWMPTVTDIIDCMICTIYDGDYLDCGDYIYVDTSKYLSAGNRAYVELLIASERDTSDLHFWELRASLARREPAPLIFRPFGGESPRRQDAAAAAQSSFGDWIHALAKWQIAGKKEGADALCEALLSEVWSVIGIDVNDEKTLETVLKDDTYKTRQLFWNRHQEAVVIATFEWDAETAPEKNPLPPARHGS